MATLNARRYAVLTDTLAHIEADASSPPHEEREPAPWESSLQATCECLSLTGSLDNLERRHAEDALGETRYAAFPAHVRSALVTAHSLMDKGLIRENELLAKMSEVRARFAEA